MTWPPLATPSPEHGASERRVGRRVHLDLSHGVPSEVDKWLFEAVVLGLAVDPDDAPTLALTAPRVCQRVKLAKIGSAARG